MSASLDCLHAGDVNGDKAVIWLHGLGASGHDFEPIVPELNLPADHDIHFIFPHAPNQPVSLNGGMAMPSWYDIVALQADAPEDEAGIKRSEQAILKLIEAEQQRGVKSENIILAGFSQGGVMALYSGLRHRQQLGGIMALSCYLPLAAALIREANQGLLASHELSIFQAHGQQDPVVTYSMGETSRDHLQQLGYKPKWHSYAMQHSVCEEEIQDIGNWLKQRFGYS